MNGDAVDTGQYGAMRSITASVEHNEQVFARFNERMKRYNLASYVADYINEELSRGNEIDCFVVLNALEAFDGGAA
jgi:hypothetical protein